MLQVTQSVVPMLERPDASSTQISQCLYGEQVELLEREPDYFRVRNCRDDYTGYVAAHFLTDEINPSTHYVNQRSTLLFRAADIKSAVVVRLPFSAEITAQNHDDYFLRTHDGLFAVRSHFSEKLATSSFVALTLTLTLASNAAHLSERQRGAPVPEPVELAQALFAGCPYLWGGRSPDGCDCSGLVQVTTFALGLTLPRDSGPQEKALGEEISFAARQRNDIVFWPGHVGILKDADTLLHATAHSMLTVTEPLQGVIERAGPVSSLRRLPLPRR